MPVFCPMPPARVNYAQLVEYFWHTIDPTVRNRQFCDVGSQYRSAIFWQTEEERTIAERSRDALLASGRFKEIQTEIVKAGTFYPAEAYHQDYFRKNPDQAYCRAVIAPKLKKLGIK